MSKPTNTALNVNDNFSGSNFNPQYGDVASQGQVTLKSDTTGATAPRPSHRAADHTENDRASYRDSITVSIDGSRIFTYPDGQDVNKGHQVKLESTGMTDFSVCTYQGGTSKDVFKGSAAPYTADGSTYTLLSGITGAITLVATTLGSCATTLSHRHEDDDCRGLGGMNGTINVGG